MSKQQPQQTHESIQTAPPQLKSCFPAKNKIVLTRKCKSY